MSSPVGARLDAASTDAGLPVRPAAIVVGGAITLRGEVTLGVGTAEHDHPGEMSRISTPNSSRASRSPPPRATHPRQGHQPMEPQPAL